MSRSGAPKLIFVVIDGLTPAMFEHAVEERSAPTLARLAEHGRYRRAVSAFPSLTPVCLSSIATGGHPDVHHIPHLVWYHRGERRLVEYGSSFAAMRSAGTLRVIRDAVFTMNERHLSADAVTVYEALEDAGFTAAVVNMTCYRGRTRHAPVMRGLTRPAYGPKRFFFFNLFESDVTGAPVAVRRRAEGSTDAYAAVVGRWLVTRDGFDFLVLYLPDYDFASHASGPDAAHVALARSDAAVGALVDAAGGLDAFLARYAVVVCADHGQTRVEHAARLDGAYSHLRLWRRNDERADVVVTASNRVGMVYRLPACPLETRELAELLDGEDAAEAVMFLEDGEAVVRREREEARFARADGGWRIDGDAQLVAYPNALERVWAALHNPAAGEVLVSAADGYEFVDLGGRHHVGGGSHGSLLAGDSEVPLLTVGLDAEPTSIVDLAPLALVHFGVEPPPYARPLARAA